MDKNTSSKYFGYTRTEIEEHVPMTVDRLLEIGCGTGQTVRWLRGIRDVAYAAGVEINDASAVTARENFDEVEACPAEVSKHLESRDCFDLVLALDVLEHLPDPQTMLHRLFLTMKPGGVLIVSLPNVANYSVAWPLFFKGQWTYTDEGHLDRTHLRFFDQASAISLLKSAGLEIKIVTTTVKTPDFFGRLGWRSPRSRRYGRKLGQFLMPRHMWISQFVISASKPV